MTTQSELPIPSLEREFHIDALLGPIEDHGITRAGHRRVVPIIGGSVSGLIAGQVLPGGADWQIVREDGTVEIDTRYSLQTNDGELLHMRTRGLRTGNPDVLEGILAGEQFSPADYYFRIIVEVESAAPRYSHLERCLIVGVGARTADRVLYDAYRVT